MEKLHFNILIDASPEKVWKTLWDDATYPQWTAPFCEGSSAVSDWKEGSKILFLSPKGDGMASVIDTIKPNEFMSFKHLGFVKDNVEDYTSDEVKKWAGCMEDYYLTPIGNKTEVRVEMDMTDDMKDYFNDIFPKALSKLKQVAES